MPVGCRIGVRAAGGASGIGSFATGGGARIGAGARADTAAAALVTVAAEGGPLTVDARSDAG